MAAMNKITFKYISYKKDANRSRAYTSFFLRSKLAMNTNAKIKKNHYDQNKII